MITQGKCSVDPAFLAPVLGGIWLSGRTIDPERQALALKQITFYAGELKQKNPYRVDENKDVVERGRMYLSTFGGVERLYRGIVEEANKSPRMPARLADLAPNFKQVLVTPGRSAGRLHAGWIQLRFRRHQRSQPPVSRGAVRSGRHQRRSATAARRASPERPAEPLRAGATSGAGRISPPPPAWTSSATLAKRARSWRSWPTTARRCWQRSS